MEPTSPTSDSAARAHLRALARRFGQRGATLFGLAQEVIDRQESLLTDIDAEDYLFDRIAHAIGDPQVWRTPQRVLEIGCGSAPFVLSALLKGHDAVGFDNDWDRLALAHAKVDGHGLPPDWRARLAWDDAEELSLASNAFDLTFGWQVIEHIPNLTAALFHAVRVTRPGGYCLFWAPDYRVPYEPHYEIPWPPFASRRVAQRWLLAMDRPVGGLDHFRYVTLPETVAILEALGCDIVWTSIDRPVDLTLAGLIDVSTDAALVASARRMCAGMAGGSLPPSMSTTTTFGVAARKR